MHCKRTMDNRRKLIIASAGLRRTAKRAFFRSLWTASHALAMM
jgi:hypothetical protein